MIRILANDGIDETGKAMLLAAGFEVSTKKIEQQKLAEDLNEGMFDAILVRSATNVTRQVIESCPCLKLIGRAGVGMDNIDVSFAASRGLKVVNTPESSSQSVAELVFAHLYGMLRFLPDSNRLMPQQGNKTFDELKKKFSKGRELKGKTLGIIGFGRIGQAVAAIALGSGMKVIAYDPFIRETDVFLEIDGHLGISVTMKTIEFGELLAKSDFITLHVPHPPGSLPLISAKDFDLMKTGVGIVNAARGGVVNETDLLEAINKGKVSFAGLDVFENEPTPSPALLNHPHVSLSPHIGASTLEAQERIGIELAKKVIAFFKP